MEMHQQQVVFANEDARTALNGVPVEPSISTIRPDSESQFEPQRQEGLTLSSNPVGLPPAAEHGLSFLLFRIAGAEESYILKWEVETSGVKEVKKAYVRVDETDNSGTWKLVKDSTPDIEPSSYPVVEDFDPPKFKRDRALPEALFQDRLKGWTVEKRNRNRADKSYTYRFRLFRSLVEVAAYILYSSTKDLKLDDTYTNLRNIVELDDNILHLETLPIEDVCTSLDAMFENLAEIRDFNWYWPSAKNPYYLCNFRF